MAYCLFQVNAAPGRISRQTPARPSAPIFCQPGMAASRIAFSLADAQANKDIWIIDSDGENLRRITNNQALSISPAWNPSGTKLAYSSEKGGSNWRIYELDLATGRDRMIPPAREGDHITPAE